MSDSIADWLNRLGLDQYARAFNDNAIELDQLADLNNEFLKDIGVSVVGHRMRILKAAAALAENTAPTSPAGFESADADETLSAWERQPGERKPVTMLFADIMGSTELTEKLDAEETHDLLYGATQRMCAAVENNHGTVCRFMGDGVMAMFGAPVASEHHAIEACEAAMEMQQAIRDYAADGIANGLQIRVGLHSGEVVVLTVGEGDRVEYDASGPTVPVAARMEQSATPGQIYLTAATRALAGPRIETEALAPISVKGISKPVSAFSLRNVRSAEEFGYSHSRTPFVGRRAELAQFRSLLKTCIDEGQGQTLYVRGEPGIGKTRLVEEFARIASERKLSIHRGLVLPFGVSKGKDAIRSLVRSLLGIPPGASADERLRAAQSPFADGWLAPDQAVFLNDLLDLPQPLEQKTLYDAMENTSRNEGKQAVVSALISAASRVRPLLAIVEDVHWSNTLTLAHLAAMTRTVADCPAVLVMSSRIEGDQLDQNWRNITDGAPFVSIDLGPLRKQESMALIGEFLDTTDALAMSCMERAAGNPLFLEQLLRNAQEGGGDSIPDSIQTLVLARLDRLRPDEKRALQAASVMGQRFGSDALSHLLGMEAYDCSELVAHNLIRAQEDGYLFAHALIQESVYGSVLKRERIALHKKAADWFANNDRVLHAQHLDMAGDERACAAYLEAAEEQAHQYRYEAALNLIERALQLDPRQADRHPLTCLKAELLLAMGNIESSITVFRDAEQRAEDDLQRCDAWIGLAADMRVKTQYEDGLAYLEKAESVATKHGRVGELSRLHHLRGNLLFSLGRADECRREHSSALAFAEQARSPENEARALGGLGDAEYVRGRMRTAHDYYSRCIELARQHGLGQVEVAHVGQRGWTLLFTGDWQGAKRECLTAIELASKVGDRRAQMNSSQCLADCVLDLGEYDLAKTYINRTLALAESLGARAWQPQALVCKALLGLAHGQQQEARGLLKEALEITHETGRAFQRARVLGTLAWVVKDDNDAREVALSEGEEVLREDVVSHNYFWFYRSAMDTMLYLGDWDRVERYASALEDYTLEEPLGWTDFFVARARALADFGRGKRDEATLKELERLRDVADSSGLKITVVAIKNALATE